MIRCLCKCIRFLLAAKWRLFEWSSRDIGDHWFNRECVSVIQLVWSTLACSPYRLGRLAVEVILQPWMPSDIFNGKCVSLEVTGNLYADAGEEQVEPPEQLSSVTTLGSSGGKNLWAAVRQRRERQTLHCSPNFKHGSSEWLHVLWKMQCLAFPPPQPP